MYFKEIQYFPYKPNRENPNNYQFVIFLIVSYLENDWKSI